MKVFMKILLVGVFLVLVGNPVSADRKPIPAPGPHEEYYTCGTWCENTCEKPHGEDGSCIRLCKQGNFCVEGYIRENQGGPCILPSECLSRLSHQRIPI